MFRHLAVALLGLIMVSTTACAENHAPKYQAGVDYELISPAQPTEDSGTIEVVEVFWYGCPHCYHLEPTLAAWVKKLPQDVRFVRMPAASEYKPVWDLHARAYYTAEILGVLNELHQPLFDANQGQTKLETRNALADFFVSHGVDRDLFFSKFESFPVKTLNLGRSRDMMKRYGVAGVPAIVIQGKYLVTARLAKSQDNMFKIMDYLIEQERQARR